MDKNEIAGILRQQILKPDELHFNYDAWKTQTASLLSKFFGNESDEYKSLYRPTVTYYSGYETAEERRQMKQKEIDSIKATLRAAVETILITGPIAAKELPKPPKVNFLYRISESWLIFWATALLSLIGLSFYIGYWYGEHSKNFFTPPFGTNNKTEIKANSAHDTSKNKKDK